MSDAIESTTSAPQSTYTPPQQAAATAAFDNGLSAVSSFKEKTSYLRAEDYWVGSKPRQDVVSNLYSLSTSGNITPEHWNKYGNAALSWEKQSGQITNIALEDSGLSVPAPDGSVEEPDASVPSLEPEDTSVMPGPEVADDVRTVGAEHTVKNGETLSRIAKEHGIDLEDLIEFNKGTISNPNRISVGQTIKLPQQERSVEIPADPGMSAQEEPTREEPLYEEPPHYEPHVPESPAAQTEAVQTPMSYAHLLPPEPESEVVHEEPAPAAVYSVATEELPDTDPAGYSTRSLVYVEQDEIPNPYPTVTIDPNGSRQVPYLENGSGVDVSLPPSGDEIIARSLINIGVAPLRDAVSFIKDAGERVLSTSKDLMARAQEQSSGFISGLFSERSVYRIGKGDTLTSIAKKHDITPARLLWDNRDIVEGTRIKEGRLLTVNKSRMPESEQVQAGIYYSNAVRLENPLIHPEMRRLAPELFKAFEENGYLVEIYSDFRTFERQAQLHKSNKWPAAPAGYSDHNWGLAVDIRLYRKSPNGSYVRLAAQSIPAEMAKHPAMTRELREKGLAWAGANDPMHFSVSTVNTDYGSMIARRREAINMIGAKEGQLTPAQQRIVMYYVRSYADNPSLPKEDRIRLAMNYSQDE